MKILCLIDSLTFGGAQTQMANIACDLKDYGHQVTLVTYYKGGDYDSRFNKRDLRVICLEKRSRFSILPILKLRSLIKAYDFDIALAFLYTPSLYLELACIGLKKPKLVVSERSVISNGRKTLLLSFFAAMHCFADAVTTNNNTHYRWLLTNFPWLKAKLHLIRNSVSLEYFSPLVNEEKHKPLDELCFLSVARVQPEKNAITLVKALETCIKKFNMRATIMWAGEVVDKDYYSKCCNLLKDLGIEKYWHWLGVRDDVSHLMKHSDALIAPSLFEGHPNAICEALASGLPILASNVCDIPQLVRPGLTGFLFAPESSADIASKIVEFANLTNDQRRSLANNCRDYALENLSSEKCSLAYQNLFRKLISSQ
ncbi:glycosyltransferase [Erysipelotrichia bacterium]